MKIITKHPRDLTPREADQVIQLRRDTEVPSGEWVRSFRTSRSPLFSAEFEGYKIVMVKDEGKTIGFASLVPNFHKGKPNGTFMTAIVVSPEHKGRDVGSMLFREAVERHGAKGAFMHKKAELEASYQLALSSGFQPVQDGLRGSTHWVEISPEEGGVAKALAKAAKGDRSILKTLAGSRRPKRTYEELVRRHTEHKNFRR